MPRLTRSFFVLVLCLLGLVVGCGSDEEDATGGGAAATPAAKPLKVGIVTDIGGLNDRSFNSLAYAGLQQSQKELGVQGRALTSKSNADYVPNLSTLAQQRYDLIIGVGFLMADAVNTVAKRFPKTNFAIIDVSQAGLKDKPVNVRGLIFKEAEAGYLAGYIAGSYLKEQGGAKPTVSSVGGQKIPPVDAYIAGYRAGAKAANPDVRVLNDYSQDFVDQAKCKELALNQIRDGSKVVFQVAGQCGLGSLDAAKQEGVQGIGVDADQSFLGSHILTSAIKKIDVAVLDSVKQVRSKTFKGGEDSIFDVQSGGVGLGKTSSEGDAFTEEVQGVQERIAAGEITIPDQV